MKSEKETIMNYDEIVKRIGIQEDTILGVYMYGSRVYGNFRKNSDHDFIVVLADGFKKEEQYNEICTQFRLVAPKLKEDE